MNLWLLALAICGLFSLALGSVHFFFPLLLDFKHAIPLTGSELKPFRLGPIRYATKRQDVHGIAWVMNHAASYTLISVGVADLTAGYWLGSSGGVWLALWISGWWALRSASQFYLGRRPGDYWIAAGFLWLALVHLGVVLLGPVG